jgi:hypothetical protein
MVQKVSRPPGGAEATGDFLFNLGHAHRLFTEVVGEGDPGDRS